MESLTMDVAAEENQDECLGKLKSREVSADNMFLIYLRLTIY